jgi:hypothetical protein
MSENKMQDDPFKNLQYTPVKKYYHFNPYKQVSDDNKENSSENNKDLSPCPFYLYHSPSSLEQYIESFSRNKIRIVKEESCCTGSHCEVAANKALFETPKVNKNLIAETQTPSAKKVFSSNIKFEASKMLQKRERTSSVNTLFSSKKSSTCFKENDNQSTLFSTSKKHRRARKSRMQMGVLQEYLRSHGTEWSKELVKEISKKSGMKQSVVYKWIWDQKNKN